MTLYYFADSYGNNQSIEINSITMLYDINPVLDYKMLRKEKMEQQKDNKKSIFYVISNAILLICVSKF